VEEPEDGEGDPSELSREKPLNVWDRIRNASQMEKISAVKADRSERSMLLRTTIRACCCRCCGTAADSGRGRSPGQVDLSHVPDCGRHHEERPVDGQSRRPPGPHPQRQDPAAFGLRILPTLPG